MIVKKEIDLAGRKLTLETGRLALQANGAVLARYGGTAVLATVVASEPREDLGYFPLIVDYIERLYAGGRIKGSRFVKREGKPSDEAILTDRLIDRTIRPLFPKDYFNEVQVVIIVLSVDEDHDPAILSSIATSTALYLSDLPFTNPAIAIRIGHREGSFILNPTQSEREFSDLDLVVGATKDKVVMLEGAGQEVPEEVVVKATEFGQEKAKEVINLLEELKAEAGKEKAAYEKKEVDPKVKKEVSDFVKKEFLGKKEVMAKLAEESFIDDAQGILEENFEGKLTKAEMGKILEEEVTKFVRQNVLEEGKRLDGRKPEEIRNLECEVGLLPRTHGSALFQRGATQVLTSATLGSTSLEQLIEGMTGEETKRYIHHYYFPPFSTGEVGRIAAPRRREIGHGALAERALLPTIPPEEKFPYTVRLVSEVLSSAGSTSMAAVCGSTLALMDAGVPISASVAGIAMGLISNEKKQVVLSDIGPSEDAGGDMDFKIAGTQKGITALQMDTKLSGVELSVLERTISQAKEGRLFILEKMQEVIGKPREELSEYAPKITTLKIDPKKIGMVIGPGGKVIKSIIEATGVAIDVKDDGTILISSTDETQAKRAREWIEGLVKEVKAGDVFEGKATRVVDFGVFVEIMPGKEGLVHVSELAHRFIKDPKSVVKVGDKIKVKVLEIDERGRINLSKKALEKAPAGSPRRFQRKPLGYRTPYHQRRGYKRF